MDIIIQNSNGLQSTHENNKFHLLIMSFDAFQFTLRQNVLAGVVTITIRKWHFGNEFYPYVNSNIEIRA